MVVDNTSHSYNDTKLKLHDLVSIYKMSSIEMISEQIGLDEETTKEYLQELVEEGSISGSISADGTRFFLSGITISSTPTVPHEEIPMVTGFHSSRQALAITLTGLIMIIAGSITRGLASIDFRFDNVGTAVFMMGLLILIVGWVLYSKANPPQIV